MVDFNFFKRITVKINNSGSGVIVKPCTDEYCYVFTDWHVIENLELEDIYVEYYVVEKDEDDEDFWSLKKEKPTAIYKNEKKDVAILIMPASMARNFVKLRNLDKGKNLYHVGFPDSLRGAECESQWNAYHIQELLDKLNHGFISYEYQEAQAYEDLSGTSGGGIFTDDGCLIGLHQGSSIKRKTDYYPKCNLIPVKFFKTLINKDDNPLEQVWVCNWNSFDPFLQDAFNINKGEAFRQMMSTLAAKLNEIKGQCQQLSPKDIKNKLDIEQIANEKCFQNCFDNKGFGISFLEYIVCMYIMYDLPLTIEGVCKMVKNSLFIYWERPEDDIWQAAKNIDSSYLKNASSGQNIYVGGLKSSSYEFDVIKKGDKHILDISRPLLNEEVGGLDVANPTKLEYNYISTCLFTDSIIQKIKEFDGLDGEQAINHYKTILREKIL